jgi:hypothetical protein
MLIVPSILRMITQFCKNLFQTPKSNQNEGNDFENDEIQMEVCCPSGKEIPQCDSESIEINDMIDLLPLRFQRIKKTSLRCSIQNLSKVANPGHKAEEFSMK